MKRSVTEESHLLVAWDPLRPMAVTPKLVFGSGHIVPCRVAEFAYSRAPCYSLFVTGTEDAVKEEKGLS